jgi:hypothetical protein
MAMVSSAGMRWRLPPESEAESLINPCELELVRQTMVAALGSGGDCEIEQMVRLRSVLPVRRRVHVCLERSPDNEIIAVRISFGRDGEPVAEWVLLPQEHSHDATAAEVEAINALTAVILHAEAVKRRATRPAGVEQADASRTPLAEISASIEHILANAHRAWRQIGDICRPRVAPVS